MAPSVRFGPQRQVLKLALNAQRAYFLEYKGKTTSCWTYHINLLFIIDVVQIIQKKDFDLYHICITLISRFDNLADYWKIW